MRARYALSFVLGGLLVLAGAADGRTRATPLPTPTATPPAIAPCPEPGDPAAPVAEGTRRPRSSPTPGPAAALAGVAATVMLDPIAAPIVVGQTTTLSGSGFTAGSVIIAFMRNASGEVVKLGPYTPVSWTPSQLEWAVSPTIALGLGFAIVQVVNTDQNYVGSNLQSQRLHGSPSLNMPTILSVAGAALQGPDATLTAVYVSQPVFPNQLVSIGGTGFNDPLVNLYTGAGNLGPLAPEPGGTSTQLQVRVPAGAPLGLAGFELVNDPYSGNVGSQVVFAPLGGPPNITSISQAGTTVTVNGSGFASGAVINLFNQQGQLVLNLGGRWPTNGQPTVPLTVSSAAQFTFSVPPTAMTGPAYAQVINPPYIGFTSTGNDPQGGFVLSAPRPPRGGSSLRFFGTGSGDVDRVKIPLGATLPGRPVDVGGNFTLEFWMKTAAGNASGSCVVGGNSWVAGNVIVDRDVLGDGDAGDYGVSLFGSGGRLAFGVDRLGSGTTICGAANVADGVWHHVAVTRDASTGQLRIFVDGQADATGTGPTGDVGYRNGRATSVPNSDPFLVIGAEKHDLGDFFPSYHGWVDEVRISSIVRYTGAFTRPAAPFAPDANTVALYHFDEGNGNAIFDGALAVGGPSDGVRRFAAGQGPHWSTDIPFSSSAPAITLQTLTTSLTGPTTIAHCGDNRLFITEQGGTIRIWDGTQLLPTPFLTVSPVASGGEQGLLGLAFHPQYAQNGFFYVYYNPSSSTTTLARYRVSSNPDIADPNSRVTLLTVPQPATNHNGGSLQFGSDGYLYVGKGDGGGSCDNQNGGCNAQRNDTLLGKILRLDVDQNINTAPFHGIPPTNPFVGPGDPLDQIWAKGVRNPWRVTVDKLTKALFIGDVGQNTREEVDYQLAESAGGENYGWKVMEGMLCGTCALTGCVNPAACNSPALTLPILDYDHSLGCSITGGYVYRGQTVPFLYGKYIHGDLCSGRIWWSAQNNGTWTATQFAPTAGGLWTFGEDVYGELYIGRGNGTLTRIR